jgi:hypothetical protein
MTSTSTTDVVARFVAEQDTIQRFTQHLEQHLTLSSYSIDHAYRFLIKHKLLGTDEDSGESRQRERVEKATLQEMLSDLLASRPKVREALAKAADKRKASSTPGFAEGSYESGLAKSFLEYLDDDVSEEAQRAAIDAMHYDFVTSANDIPEEDIEEFEKALEQVSDAASRLVAAQRADEVNEELQGILELIDESELVARTSEEEAEINTQRQSYILMMTAFDAAIFDLVAIALEKDFFRLIGWFAEKEKLALDKLFDYSSFEQLRDAVIERQLKAKYLKDLLFILNGHGISYVDGPPDRPILVIELVQRRNLHIHNRGYVDARYLENDDTGVPRYNVYGLAEGSFALIDKPYLEKANRLCRNCVERIAAWVDSL